MTCQVYSVLVAILMTSQWCGAADQRSTHERIRYHLQELSQGLAQLTNSSSTNSPHHLHKRSTSAHDEVIFNSLIAFCNQLNPESPSPRPALPANPSQRPSTASPAEVDLSALSIPNPALTDIAVNATPIATWPHLFPLKVQGQREGNAVWLIFHVIHTSPMTVYRQHSFDPLKMDVDYPQEFRPSPPANGNVPILSQVRMKVDASLCQTVSRGYTISIGFTLKGESPYWVSVGINLCRFDYVRNTTSFDQDSTWYKKPEKIISEHISRPSFKVVTPDPGDEVVVKRGHNVTMEIEVVVTESAQVSIQVQLWDRVLKGKISTAHSIIHIDKESPAPVQINPHMGNGGDDYLLGVEVLETLQSDNITVGDDGEVGSGVSKVRLGVTVATSSGKRSGKLYMTYFRMPSGASASILETVEFTRKISLKLAHRSNLFPKNHAEIRPYDRPYECDSDGNIRFPKHGKNCTVHCHAFGANIRDIFISTTGVQQPRPVASVSVVMGNGSLAFAMVDMGPASPAIDGSYRCTVVAANGRRKRKQFKLFTSLFTRVSHASLTDLDNDTAMLTCQTFGQQPLNVSFVARTEDGGVERLDNKTINTPTVTTDGHQRNLTLLVSTDQLKYPTTHLQCEAGGERGTDSFSVQLDHYNSPQIDTMANASSIVDYVNGSVLITCAASGVKPLEFWLMYGGNARRYRIDNRPGAVTSLSQTASGESLSLLVDIESIFGRGSWLACRVGNRFGDDWHNFYIPDYVHF